MEIILNPRRYRKAQYLRIKVIVTTWDRQAKAYLAILTFETTRDVQDCVPLGVKLFGQNVETLVRLIQDQAILYAPSNALAVSLPEFGDETLHFSRVLPDGEGELEET